MTLEAKGLTVRFGGVLAVDEASIEVGPGETLAIVGPNGSGKTTLLNAMTGLVPRRGLVRVDNTDLRAESPAATRRAGVIRTFQTPQVIEELTCVDNVLLAAEDRRFTGVLASWVARRPMLVRERLRWAEASEALRRYGLAEHASVPASQLSYGQRRWLELARAAMARPRYLLADEPSAGLNDGETEHLAVHLRSLREDGVGVVLVDHKVDFLRYVADRAAVLALGRVVAQDDIEAVWDLPAVREAYLGAGRGRR